MRKHDGATPADPIQLLRSGQVNAADRNQAWRGQARAREADLGGVSSSAPSLSAGEPVPKAGESALEALVDAAAGILAADSLRDTLGRIAHHMAAVVPHDDLTVYEVDPGETLLRPVFAVGAWVEEVMLDVTPIGEGVTGWVVRNRQTRNVPNTMLEPLCVAVPGTDDEPEAFVAVPLIAHDRVVGSLNVYRTGADRAFSETEVELVERFATMAALAYDSARQREALREEVKTDGLTGLLNHRGCQERLRGELEQAGGRPLSVVVLDLDHFKRINDTHGHAEGDRALATAAARLRAVVRDSDAVGRLGGEEFVLVLPGTDAAAARDAAERARAALGEVHVGGRPLACSAGVACFPDDATVAAELLACADAALYAAKDAGRGRTCRYRVGLALRPSPGESREEVEALLRDARTAIRPVFQPVLELTTGRVCGYEALARMSRPAPPGTRRVVRAGARRRPRGRARGRRARGRTGHPGPSGRILHRDQRQPARAGLGPGAGGAARRPLEHRRGAAPEHDLFGAEASLNALPRRSARARGPRGARRRGAGYAGLQQLIRVAPDILKLDRSLVHGAHADPAKLALVRALISFAGSTGAAVCGEGVEDLADLRMLAELDATYAQGYAVARPAPGWPEAAPAARAVASARMEAGVRIADAPYSGAGAWSRPLAELVAELARVSHASQLAPVGIGTARLLGADDVALMRVDEEDHSLVLLSEHEESSPGERWPLAVYPATEHLLERGLAGQVVVGDLESDRAEREELERTGHGAMLMVPITIGAGGRGLMEVYRTHPRAFSSAEVDRARVVALQFAAVLSRLADG